MYGQWVTDSLGDLRLKHEVQSARPHFKKTKSQIYLKIVPGCYSIPDLTSFRELSCLPLEHGGLVKSLALLVNSSLPAISSYPPASTLNNCLMYSRSNVNINAEAEGCAASLCSRLTFLQQCISFPGITLAGDGWEKCYFIKPQTKYFILNTCGKVWEMRDVVCKVVGGGGLIQQCRKPKFGSHLCLRKLQLLSPILKQRDLQFNIL